MPCKTAVSRPSAVATASPVSSQERCGITLDMDAPELHDDTQALPLSSQISTRTQCRSQRQSRVTEPQFQSWPWQLVRPWHPWQGGGQPTRRATAQPTCESQSNPGSQPGLMDLANPDPAAAAGKQYPCSKQSPLHYASPFLRIASVPGLGKAGAQWPLLQNVAVHIHIYRERCTNRLT